MEGCQGPNLPWIVIVFKNKKMLKLMLWKLAQVVWTELVSRCIFICEGLLLGNLPVLNATAALSLPETDLTHSTCFTQQTATGRILYTLRPLGIQSYLHTIVSFGRLTVLSLTYSLSHLLFLALGEHRELHAPFKALVSSISGQKDKIQLTLVTEVW